MPSIRPCSLLPHLIVAVLCCAPSLSLGADLPAWVEGSPFPSSTLEIEPLQLAQTDAGTLLRRPQRQTASPQSIPRTGVSGRQVIRDWGVPKAQWGPVGQPPISRWDYDTFSAFFEYDRVVHAVRHGKRGVAPPPPRMAAAHGRGAAQLPRWRPAAERVATPSSEASEASASSKKAADGEAQAAAKPVADPVDIVSSLLATRRIRELIAALDREFESVNFRDSPVDLPSGATAILTEVLSDAVDSEAAYRIFSDSLLAAYDEKKSPAALRLARDRLIRAVDQSALDAFDIDDDALRSYVTRVEKRLIPQARRDLIDAVYQLHGGDEVMLRSSVVFIRGLLRMSQLLTPALDRPSDAEVEQQVQRAMRQVSHQARLQAIATYAHMLRPYSDAQLRRYINLMEGEGGIWLIRNENKALLKVFEQVGQRIGEGIVRRVTAQRYAP